MKEEEFKPGDWVTVIKDDGHNYSSHLMVGKAYQIHKNQKHDTCWSLDVESRKSELHQDFYNGDGGYYVRKEVVRRLLPEEISGYKPEINNTYEYY